MARALSRGPVELLAEGDVLAAAQCIVIDADAFPYESARFGRRPKSAFVWVARDAEDGSVRGFLAGRAKGGRLEIDGIAVDQRSRRRGIGRSLVQAARDASQGMRLRSMVLHVSVKNDGAIALYESEGFVIRRRLRDFYPPTAFGEERAALEMVCWLSS